MSVNSHTFLVDEPVRESPIMTTSIDQAFRKAYAKRTGKPAADDSIAVWIDEPSGQFFRSDTAHDNPSSTVAAPRFLEPNATKIQPAAQQTQPAVDPPVAGSTTEAVSEPIPAAAPTDDVVAPMVEEAATSPTPAPEVLAESPIETAIDIRPGTTAYDAWSAKLQTLELPKPADKPVDVVQPSAKPSAPVATDALPAFAPVWEVDEFALPEVATSLIEKHLQPMGAQLERASREGLQTLAVSSQNRETGRSTVAIAIAQVAANTGLRVALVDADTESPSLLEKLQLEMTNDWVDAIAQDVSIEEIAVLSISNNFCFLPLLPKSHEQLKQIDRSAAALFDRLKLHFDMIVVDFGPLNHASFGLSIPLSDEFFDAVVLIEDMQRIDPETLESYARRIRAVGIENIGLIENFSSNADADAA